MKKYKKEIGAFLDPKCVDKIHKYNHKWLLDEPKWLWKKFEHNRDAYTESKTDFVKKYTLKAKNIYGDRY